KETNINFIPMPEDIREKYQYYTCANIQKLRNIGYNKDFYSVEEGVKDYVLNYLSENKYF
ncbi:MAG: ADP-L-glycero-D-mannoheptose-6-epimerase, partial [Bacteroidota bacterium]|nr:ADP-L-glycero-D-mannoheptose-6-epimerase [Bacteroidota bacterium]